jgi:hypothetical protein
MRDVAVKFRIRKILEFGLLNFKFVVLKEIISPFRA